MADKTVEDLGIAAKKVHPGTFDHISNVQLGRAVKLSSPDDFSDIADPFPHMQSLGPPGASVPTPGRGQPGDPPAFPTEGIMGLLHTPIHGVQQIIQGVHRMHSDDEGETRGGVSDVAQGVMKVLSPYAGQQILTNPVGALKVGAGALVGGGVGDVASNLSGASQGQSELNSTVGQIVGGALGPITANKSGEALVGVKNKLLEAYRNKIAEPGGKKIVHGAITAAASLPVSMMGHTIAGPLMALRGGSQLIEGLGEQVAQPSAELPKGNPTPWSETNAAASRQVTAPGQGPQQTTSEGGVRTGTPPTISPTGAGETSLNAEQQMAQDMGIRDYDSAGKEVKQLVQGALARKSAMESKRTLAATTPVTTPSTNPALDPSLPTSRPFYNTFKQEGGPYKITSAGGAELGSYNNLADAQKALNDSNFAKGAARINGPKQIEGELPKGSSTMFNSNNPPGGHEVLGIPPTPVKANSSAVAGVAFHEPTGEAALHMTNGKKLVYPDKTAADVEEMINHESPGTLYNQKWKGGATTDTSIMKSRPPGNTPPEQMRFTNLSPAQRIAGGLLDSSQLKTTVDAKIAANRWNLNDHQTQIQQSVREAADAENLERAKTGKAPISTSAVNNVIRGYQP